MMIALAIAEKTKAEDIVTALVIMGKGMLGIFIALTFVYLFVVVLNKLFPEKKKKIEESNDSEE